MAPNEALKMAIACLEDVVSHHNSLSTILSKSKIDIEGDSDLDATPYDRKDRADEMAYYKHELQALSTMHTRAVRSLESLRGLRLIDIDAIVDAASVFVLSVAGPKAMEHFGVTDRLPVSVIYAALNANTTYEGQLLTPSVLIGLRRVPIDLILAHYIRSLAQFLPRPKESALTTVRVLSMLDGAILSEEPRHVSKLAVGDHFRWTSNPKRYVCTGETAVVYADSEVQWRVHCEDANE